MEYQVQYVKKKLKQGYIGMNCLASKELHIPFHHKHPEHTIIVWKGQNKKERHRTILHEEIEEFLMKNKHLHYHEAHKIALKLEKSDEPFNKIIRGLR